LVGRVVQLALLRPLAGGTTRLSLDRSARHAPASEAHGWRCIRLTLSRDEQSSANESNPAAAIAAIIHPREADSIRKCLAPPAPPSPRDVHAGIAGGRSPLDRPPLRWDGGPQRRALIVCGWNLFEATSIGSAESLSTKPHREMPGPMSIENGWLSCSEADQQLSCPRLDRATAALR